MDQQAVDISIDEMKRLNAFYVNQTCVQMCRNTLRQHLFANGIEYTKARTKHRIEPPHMQSLVDDYWLPFCEDVLDTIIVLGVVPIHIIKLQDGSKIPTVLKIGTFRMTIKQTLDSMEYQLYEIQSVAQKPIKDAFVLDHFGYQPTMEGTIVSLLTTLMFDVEYTQHMYKLSLLMEQKRLHPSLITEITEHSSNKNNDGVEWDFYADADAMKDGDEMKYLRTKNAVEALRDVQDMYDASSKAKTVLDHVTQLPAGQKLTNVLQAEGRRDLLAIRKSLQDIICGVMGVPRSMIMSDASHKSSDTLGTHNIFRTSIMYWKRCITKCCNNTFQYIYADAMVDQIISNNKKRKRDDINMYDIKNKLQVNINLPITPFVDNDQLKSLYEQKILSWEQYVLYVSRNTCIELNTIPPEPTDDQQKSNENEE